VVLLHEGMRTVLAEMPDHTATTSRISEEIARRDLYRQKRGGREPASQINARAFHHPELFEKIAPATLRLIGPANPSV
jgi:hypothetical protein